MGDLYFVFDYISSKAPSSESLSEEEEKVVKEVRACIKEVLPDSSTARSDAFPGNSNIAVEGDRNDFNRITSCLDEAGLKDQITAEYQTGGGDVKLRWG